MVALVVQEKAVPLSLAILLEVIFYKTVPVTCYQEFLVELAEVVEVLMAILP
jgi:uncharacterized membrane protein YhfC